jgi:cytochrome c oxidase assembly protein subunit 11
MPAHSHTAGMTPDQRSANRTLLARLCVVVVAMFGFGYLMVPLYEKFCEVTGIRNIGRADEPANTQVDTSRRVRIELDGNLRNLPWQFRAQQPLVDVHPGALTHVTFEVVNTTSRTIVGQAIPSYAPQHAAQYFRKLDCFCFTTQSLAPGERREMPVVFVIDPKLPDDLPAITLSYTFFEVEGGARVARSDASPHTVPGESK